MTFVQAVTMAWEGKKVRLPKWKTAYVVAFEEGLFIMGNFVKGQVNDRRLHPWLVRKKDFLSRDWEVVE